MRYLSGFAALLFLAACSGDPGGGPILIEAEKIALYPDVPEREDAGTLEYRGGLVLTSPDDRFGGLSALEVEDGRLLAISDSAYWLTAHLEFDDAGMLTGLSRAFYAPMLDAEGEHLTGESADAEGLAPLGNGAFAVSFEHEHRIDRYDLSPDWSGVAIATPTPLPAPPGTDRLRQNGGIEALAPAEEGYWAGIEYPIVDGRPHSLWLVREGQEPVVFNHHAAPGFGLTGLASDDNGFFVLERFWSRDVGNRVRILSLQRMIQPGEGPGAVTPVPAVLAEFEPDMTIDNFEGIAIGEVNGERRLFILSDDNFSRSQQTLLLSFAMAD